MSVMLFSGFWLTLGSSLQYLFGAFIVKFKYSLFIVSVLKCYLMVYLCGTPNRRYICGSCC